MVDETLIARVAVLEQMNATMTGERKGGGWGDPRVIVSVVGVLFSGCSVLVSLVGIAIVVFGGLFGAYVVTQTKTVTSEMSNATLSVEIQKINSEMRRSNDEINSKLDGLGKDMTTSGKLAIETQVKMESNARDTEQLRTEQKELREQLSRLDASNEKRFNDYVVMITRQLKDIELRAK